MTDLTEQWKKGKLENGMYYMENTSGIIGRVGHSKAFPCYNVKQVLAPVPSYEEWEEKLKALKVLAEAYCKEKEENKKLKELLKRCRDFINYEVPDHCIDDVLIDKIDEVLK